MKKRQKQQILFGLLFIAVLAVVMYFGNMFTFVSNVQTGIYFETQQPSLCADRYALDSARRTISSSLGNTATFGNYKLSQTYSSNSYGVTCNAPTGDSYVEIRKDNYGCAVYNSTKNAYSYTSCAGGTNCPYWGVTMCSRCTSKGACDGSTFRCNGCGSTGSNCFGKYSYFWDYCKCSVIYQPTYTYISGGFKRGASSSQAGFTYTLSYKDSVIANRTDFPMTNFILPSNTLYVSDGKISDYSNYEYRIDLGSYGGTDCNGDLTYTIDVKANPSDAKIYGMFDSNTEYKEGVITTLPLTLINNFDRDLKAKLTLKYQIATFIGSAEKVQEFTYDAPIGTTHINVPFIANSTESTIVLKPTLEFYDSGYSGLAVKINDYQTQSAFLSADAYVTQTQMNRRTVNSADWVKIKTLIFNDTVIKILPTYSNEYVQFLQMSVSEQAKYLSDKNITIAQMSQQLASAGLDNSKLNSDKAQLEKLILEKQNERTMFIYIFIAVVLIFVIMIFIISKSKGRRK